jgi:hypothetical protein
MTTLAKRRRFAGFNYIKSAKGGPVESMMRKAVGRFKDNLAVLRNQNSPRESVFHHSPIQTGPEVLNDLCVGANLFVT